MERLVPKRKSRPVRFLFRRATSALRCLPNFIIIGAQKSGTTSLFSYLKQHPQIRASFTKEVHFFDGGKDPGIDTYAKGLNWYKAHFPLQVNMGREVITGEASPLYLFNPLAPARIANALPAVKLIALLRNPADRAISHYYHEKRKNREPLPMLEAFGAEQGRISAALKEQNYKSLSYINYGYLKRGLYAEQLERYFKYFSRERMLVLKSEEFFSQPSATLSRTCKFLGVDHTFRFPDLEPRNTGKNKKPIDPKARDFLNDYYHNHNMQLFKLTGTNLEW